MNILRKTSKLFRKTRATPTLTHKNQQKIGSCTLNLLSRGFGTNQEQNEQLNPPALDHEKFRGFKNTALLDLELPGVTIVKDPQSAETALRVLLKNKPRVHAWDTECIDIEVKEQSPVGNGRIISAQAFCGPDVDFGNGPRLFIDNFGTNYELIQMFKEYFEDASYLKSWFNYGFDRHIFYNHGIDVQGFGGDSMHMGRLIDPSRGPKEYSLARLTRFYEPEIKEMKKEVISSLRQKYTQKSGSEVIDEDSAHKLSTLAQYETLFMDEDLKVNLKKIFSRRRVLKNGELGKTLEMPSIIEMHTDATLLPKWIKYATLDAEATFFLREVLVKEMMKYPTDFEGLDNIFNLYCRYWLPFGEILTDIEREGIRVNLAHLKKAEKQAFADMEELKGDFIRFVRKIQPEAWEFNPSSTQQLQQFLFAPFSRSRRGVMAGRERRGKRDAGGVPDGRDFEGNLAAEEAAGGWDGFVETVKADRNIDVMDDFPEYREFKVPNERVSQPNRKQIMPNLLTIQLFC